LSAAHASSAWPRFVSRSCAQFAREQRCCSMLAFATLVRTHLGCVDFSAGGLRAWNQQRAAAGAIPMFETLRPDRVLFASVTGLSGALPDACCVLVSAAIYLRIEHAFPEPALASLP
jgi:hypothetical protein